MKSESSPGLSPRQAVDLKIPTDPKISPDGGYIAFVVSDIAKPDECSQSSIWMKSPDGNCRQITFGPRQDSAPRWSPDGGRLAFLSDRKEEGKQQVYMLRMSGGEAVQVSDSKAGVSEPEWSPDGQWLSFIAKDPETPGEEKQKEQRIDQIVADEDYKFDRLYIVSPEGSEAHLVSSEGAAHVSSYCWSPDSKSLAAVITRTPRLNDRAYGPCELTKLDASSTEEPCVLLRSSAGITQPAWAPDGATIAFRGKHGRVQTVDSIWIVPAIGGQARCLTADFEGSADYMVWAPDSSEIKFVAYEGLRGTLRSVSVPGGRLGHLVKLASLPSGTFGSGISFSRDGQTYAVSLSSATTAPEAYEGSLESLSPVSKVNAGLSSVHFAPGEHIEWSSSDDTQIAGLLFRPLLQEEGTLCPLVVQVHGGPAWLWTDRYVGTWHDWAQLLAAKGFAVLLPNPRGSTGRGYRFTDAEVNDMGGMELTDVMSGVDHVLEMGFVDPERLGIGGWSHGGYLSAWAITQSERFRAAVVGAGVSNMISDQGENDIPGFNDNYFYESVYADHSLYWERSPLAHMRNVRTPTLILHGEKDERVTQPQGQELYRALKHVGVETQFVTYPREGHSIQEREHQLDLIDRVVGWFERYLMGDQIARL